MSCRGKSDIKKYCIVTLATLVFVYLWLWVANEAIGSEIAFMKGDLKRLTFSSKDEVVKHPSIDRAGTTVVYRREKIDPQGDKRSSVELLRVGETRPKVLFEEGKIKAPKPMDGHFLHLGTKPPVISGDGNRVIFSMSLGSPIFIDDHYLGVINADGTDLRVIELVNEQIGADDLERWKIADNKWRTISQYRITDDGRTIACLVKGQGGGKNLSNPSGIVLVQWDGSSQKTLLAPRLEREGWIWEGYPRNPFTGGGWIFDLSADGKKVVFGAQSGPESTDYDIYSMETDGKNPQKLTDVKDRWFVRGTMSMDSKVFCFFYSGKKLQGIGTYTWGFGKEMLCYLRSRIADRVDFEGMSGDGRRIFYRVLEKGIAFIEADGSEKIISDGRDGGFKGIKGAISFPVFPSFWSPRFISMRGDRVLMEAIPEGKDGNEIFLLTIPVSERGVSRTCPVCGRLMDPQWKFCPFDGKALGKERR